MNEDQEWQRFKELKFRIAIKTGHISSMYVFGEEAWSCIFYIDGKEVHRVDGHKTSFEAKKEINDLLELALYGQCMRMI